MIVHNAGHMVFSPAEAFTPDQFIQQYDAIPSASWTMSDLNQIAALVEVVQLGSFAAAARAPKIPRSTVSACVQAPRALDFVEDGIDLAIRGGVVGSAGSISKRLPEVPFGLFASPAHLERKGWPQSLDALDAHDLLMFTGREHRRLLGLPPV